MKTKIYAEVITLEKIPLLAAISNKTEEQLRNAFFYAKGQGTSALILLDDPREIMLERTHDDGTPCDGTISCSCLDY